MISNEGSFSGKLFSFLAGPGPGYYLNEQNDLGSDEEAQCVDFVSLTMKRVQHLKGFLSAPSLIMRLRRNSHESDDSEVAVSCRKKKQTL